PAHCRQYSDDREPEVGGMETENGKTGEPAIEFPSPFGFRRFVHSIPPLARHMLEAHACEEVVPAHSSGAPDPAAAFAGGGAGCALDRFAKKLGDFGDSGETSASRFGGKLQHGLERADFVVERD